MLNDSATKYIIITDNGMTVCCANSHSPDELVEIAFNFILNGLDNIKQLEQIEKQL